MTQADLWDRFFGKAEAAKQAYDRRATLLQQAHDLMDELNNSGSNDN